MKESVLVIIINKEHKVLLQHRDVHALKNPNTWSLWGGIIEHGETPIEAARRELKEELGVDIDAERLKVFKIYKTADRVRHVFCITNDTQSKYHLQEGDDLKRVSASELKGMNVNDISFKILSDFFDLST